MNIKQDSHSEFSQCWNGVISSINMSKLNTDPNGIAMVRAMIKLIETHEDEMVKNWEDMKK